MAKTVMGVDVSDYGNRDRNYSNHIKVRMMVEVIYATKGVDSNYGQGCNSVKEEEDIITPLQKAKDAITISQISPISITPPFSRVITDAIAPKLDMRQFVIIIIFSALLKKKGFSSNRTVIIYEKPIGNETKIQFPRKFPKTYKPKKFLRFYNTCAVLGNSGILRGSRCGKEIDSHDFVMRSNMAPTIGFEDDVGVKTNLTTLNSNKATILENCLFRSKYKCRQVALDLMKEFNGSIIWFSKYGVVKSSAYVSFTDTILKQGLKTDVSYPAFGMPRRVGRFWNISSVSSGLILYTVAGAVCSKISMYGFFPFQETASGRPVPHHYYENVTFNYTKRHHMPDEYKLFLKLNRTGYIRFVTDKCWQND
ncbi:CMP-N-acetylneuraminate-poly-alpha-2,8-sialyltransferase-like [Anneissia japonica]|uniref:CMP-N-acetylneuraminate-poly-alpha-2, 8-sialyltransferase-like n=1 Tax=Anneissia japonica TaxID=1529436 RepID=UPI00142577C6|nr:CMP-N-acetylneuraminate-poly-alpha-2,8-sialyltransferase-like [Anneissia japonica]